MIFIKNLFLSFIFLFLSVYLYSQIPTPGAYNNININIGENVIINPTVSPGSYEYLSVSSPSLPGIALVINQQTGAVRLTNPQTAGIHRVFVKAVNSSGKAETEFEVEVSRAVTQAPCDPMFIDYEPSIIDTISHTGHANLKIYQVLDFNNDGIQDFISQDNSTNLILNLGKNNGDFDVVKTDFKHGGFMEPFRQFLLPTKWQI